MDIKDTYRTHDTYWTELLFKITIKGTLKESIRTPIGRLRGHL